MSHRISSTAGAYEFINQWPSICNNMTQYDALHDNVSYRAIILSINNHYIV
jgi:hypothetical protein